MIDALDTDLLILGAGDAGLCAALRAADASSRLRVTVVVKGLLGRAGCTRMVQGGYNVVLTELCLRLQRGGPGADGMGTGVIRSGGARAEGVDSGGWRNRLN